MNSDNGRLHLKVGATDRWLDSAIVSEDLTRKVVAWATETGSYAADLPSRQAREAYFAARYRELVASATAEGATQADAVILADACVDAARRITIELLANRAGEPRGQA